MKMKIRTKLLLFFTLTALPIVGVGVWSYFNSVRAVEAVVEQRTIRAVQDLAAEVGTLLKQRRNEVALLAGSQDLQDLYARRLTEGNRALKGMQGRLDAAFRQFFVGPRQAFARVMYVDPEGKLIFGYSRAPSATPETSVPTEFTTEGYSLFTSGPSVDFDPQPLRARDGLLIFNENAPPYGPVLRLGRWVKNGASEKVGFVLVDLEVGYLLQESQLSTDFESDEHPLLIERDHDRLLFHRTRSLVGKKLDRGLPGFAAVYPATDQGSGTVQYETEDGEWLASYVNLEDARWTFALLSPLSPATAAVRQAGLLNLGIIFAAVFVVLALSPIVIGRITASIRRVTEGAEAIAAGDLNQQIEVVSHDETHTLAEAFNRMASSLRTTLSDLRKLNEELEDRVQQRTAELEQANRHKSEFLASMSHDLRTPMNAIIGYTRILLRRAKDALDDRQYHNLENIQTSADNLLSLINDILDLSKIEAGRIDIVPEEVHVKQLVSDCLTSVRPMVKSDVRLEEQVDDVAAVRTDEELLRKVVMNLLGNAVKFTERGNITVTLKSVDDSILLSVADTGPGIPAADLPHIFEEFKQVEGHGQSQGTGLGLSIAKKSIEMLGGTISVESEVGKGTTFSVRIGEYKPT